MNNVQLIMMQKIVLKTCGLRENLITQKHRKFQASGKNLTHDPSRSTKLLEIYSEQGQIH